MDDTLDFEAEAQRLSSLLNTRLLDTPIDNRFERVTRLVQNMLKVPIASFNLVDKDRQWSKSAQGLSVVEIAREQSFCAHAIQGERTLIVNDARTDHRFSDNPLVTGNPNIVFYAGCPVHAPDGQKIGALCAIDKKPRELLPREVQMLRDLAGVLESELRLDALRDKIAGLEEQLSAAERNARIDSLTRLSNRAGIIDILKREWAIAMRNKTPIGVVVADIDHFRAINETHGRDAGDEVLQQLSRILLSTLRYEDSIGRTEGGEFVILLPGCPQDRILETVERIRRETLLADIETGKGILPVTMSFGANSLIPAEDMEMTDMLERADIALMAAKKQGRNQTMLYKPGLSEAA